MTDTTDTTNLPDPWLDATRVESWAGEIRVNLIRMIAIVIFYTRHLVELFLSPADSPIRGRYHLAVTAIVVAWSLQAIVLHLRLSRRLYEPWVKYAAVILDALMIT